MSSSNYTINPFKYDPSTPAASVFLGLFLVTTAGHLYQLIRSKSFYLIPIVICGVLEVTGYASRLVSIQNPSNISLYSAQYAFVVLAPIFLAASVYIMLGRIISFVDHPSLISPKRIAIIFVTCDIISFFVQIIGAIILLNTSNPNNLTLGKDILLSGLVIQIVTFAFFTVCAIHFDVSVAKSGQHGGKWRWLMKALYVACALILGRSIFRVIEFSEDNTGYLQATEWPFYIFDALLIFVTMVIFNIIHPAKYLVADPDVDMKNSSTISRLKVDGMPVTAIDNVQPI